MKVVKILGVVFGALFLLTGVGLLAGAAVFNTSGNEFDRQLSERGLAGPSEGRVVAIEGGVYTVEYTDKQGLAQTGRGAVADGTTPPGQGDDVQVYYSTADPGQIIILDFPGGNFAGVAGVLRTVAIVCVVFGAVLLLAGIIGLVTGRRRGPPAMAGPAAYAPSAVPRGNVGPDQAPTTGGPDQAAPDQVAPDQARPADAAPGPQAQPTATPTAPDLDPNPTHPLGPADSRGATPPPEQNRPG